ncbi:CHAP domain-containing protein [Crossiella sp. CA-258035]|uniref:CHAP domain-containing protein n=1 Tax=Crossiella sp. CA-258035 TaxID=2981138 RepID=UPI0024BC56B1|nr:CHAP domain-containing protein [Crossiella sp. CA-258035]WHT18635.1 CHAP domain-containing protein [Crossiella sp. CA-258035]
MEKTIPRRLARGLTVLGVGTSLLLASSVVTGPAVAAEDPDTVAPAVLAVEDLDGRPLTGAALREFLAQDATRTKATQPDTVPLAAAPVGPAANRDQIVRLAAAELGNGERPNGSNCTKYSSQCVAWCALFSTWVWRKAGVSIPQYPFTGDVYKWGQRNGKSYSKANLGSAVKGDVLLFGTGPSSPATSTHIGIIESRSGSTVKMIEGNQQNAVRRVTRTLSGSTFYGGTRP